MGALTFSLSSIVTPLTLPSKHLLPIFLPHIKKPLFLKTPLPIELFSLTHICNSSLAFNETQDSTTDEVEQDPEEDEEEDEVDEYVIENEEIKGFNSVDKSRVFVGNLPYSISSAELSQTFAQAGQVRSVEIVYDKLTDRSRGFGFVTMGNVDEAKEAIRTFDGSQIGGRTVKVNFPEVPRGGERKVMGPKIQSSNQSFVDTAHKIYVGNLGWLVSTQFLRDAFANQPGFLSAKVIYDRDTGKSRGFGFVSFSSAESAQSALSSMNGVELEGRPLRLNMAADRARSSIV